MRWHLEKDWKGQKCALDAPNTPYAQWDKDINEV